MRFLRALAARESGGDKTIINPFGYVGLFQMGELAMEDADFYNPKSRTGRNEWDGSWTPRAKFVDVLTLELYREHAGAQELAVRRYHDVIWSRIVRLRLHLYIGQSVQGIVLTKSGMIAASHLVGLGNFAKFLKSNGSDAPPQDGFGTTAVEYLKLFNGYF